MKCSTEKIPLLTFSTQRAIYNLNPPYQRESGVWSTVKKQLFVDSLMNGYDVPKIYVHELRDNRRFQYAVIDGKQRIGAIWEFFDDGFPLDPSGFTLTGRPRDLRPQLRRDQPQGGDRYSELSAAWAAELQGRSLDVVVVSDATEDDIEELFSRLNNGEPLTAAERRNAMGGDMNGLIREVGGHPFFTDRVRFSNRRLQHLEVAAKFLRIEKARGSGSDMFVDLKKRFLDELAESGSRMNPSERDRLLTRVKSGLAPMMAVFHHQDPLLGKQAYPPMYYLFLATLDASYGHPQLWSKAQTFLPQFELLRATNLALPEEQRDNFLTEYGRLIQQGTNDRLSLKRRVETLVQFFLRANPDVGFLDHRRAYSQEERFVIWVRADRKCESCGVEISNLDEMEADHELQHRFSGTTTLDNARSLCGPCNHKLGQPAR